MSSDLKLTKTNDFVTDGKAEVTAIFLHGIASDSGSFNTFFEYLREKKVPGVRVISYDLLGVGQSPKSDEYNYDLDEQMAAIENSLAELDVDTPIVICGHSMGTMLAERLVDKYIRIGRDRMIVTGTPPEESGMLAESKVAPAGTILRMVLISAPVYTADDIKNPIFDIAMEKFCEAVAERDAEIVKSKVFQNELESIIKNPENYQYLVQASVPTTMIYGKKDNIIAAFNYPGVLEKNPLIKAVETEGAHGVSPEKFTAIVDAIKGKTE